MTATAKEMHITEKMLGYVLAVIDEYGPEENFKGNSYSCKLQVKATVCPKCGKTIDSKSQKKTKKEIVNLGIVIAFVAGILVGGMSHALLFNSGKSDDKVIQTEQKESVKTKVIVLYWE